jgi:hypothetical protein
MSESVTVALDTSEYYMAMQAGCMRQVQNRKIGRPHYYGAPPDRAEQFHINGSVGEACVAKYLNKYWLGKGTFGGSDVEDYEVRSTSRPDGDLILHDYDKDDRPYISVYVSEGVGVIRGWIMGAEGKRKEFWKDPAKGRPAYFVPTSKLRPMKSLGGNKGTR